MSRLSLGLAHELGLMLAMLAAMLIVLLGGAFPTWMWLTALAPLVSVGLARRDIHVPAVSGTLLGIGAIGAGVATVVRGGLETAVFAGGSTLLGLLCARLITRRTLAHDMQALLLSLILVFAGSVLNVGLSYFLVFVVYAIAAVWALSTRQLLAGAGEAGMSISRARERDDIITPLFFAASAGVSLMVLAAAVVIFVSFPRIGFGELGFLGRKDSQLPSTVGFGSDPRGLSTSTAVVARARGVPLENFIEGLYLRGAIYDVVTLDSFSQSRPDTATAPVVDRRPRIPNLARRDHVDLDYEMTAMPVGGPIVFTLGYTGSSLGLAGGTANPNRSQHIAGRDRHDQLRTDSPLAGPFRYEVHGDISVVSRVLPQRGEWPTLTPEDRDRYLAFDDDDPAIRNLLNNLLAGLPADASVEARVTAIRRALLTQYDYSLDGPVTGLNKPLRAFLLEARAGHCELFAGAFALLLRMNGIPARVVGGFQGGGLTDDGTVVFQMRHAHAWIEWWAEGVGWIVDDATPAATAPRQRFGFFDATIERLRVFWDDRVVDFAYEDQRSALGSVRRALKGKNLGKLLRASIALAMVSMPLLWLLRRLRRRRSPKRAGDTLARHIVGACERWRGQPSAPTQTVREIVEAAPHPVLRRALAEYEGIRFGQKHVDAAVVAQLIAELKAIRAPAAGASSP